MRIVPWLILAAVLIWAFRNKKSNRGSNTIHRRPAASEPEAMVQCKECRIYLPASEALTGLSGNVFCCEEHRRRYRAN